MKNPEKAYFWAELISRQLEGTLDEEETQLLEEWLAEEASHRELLDNLRSSAYLQEKSRIHGLFASPQGFQRFLRDKKRTDRKRKLRRWASAAAAFAGIVTAGIALWPAPGGETMQEPSPVSLADCPPGRIRATLILADGQQLSLDDSLCRQIREDYARIRIEGGKVNYQPVDSGKETAFNRVVTPRGGEYSIRLADGTRVWLNAESDFKYPVAFAGNKREVWLQGEAYFEVTKDSLRPFTVRTGKMEVEVAGTSFNLKAYPEEFSQTTLVTGAVKVSAGEQQKNIRPGEQATLEEGKIIIREVDVEPYVAWKNQRFAFSDDLLEDVLRKLERWYDIGFVIRHTDIRKCRFTGNLPKYSNLGKVLEILELTTHIHFVQKGKVIVVEKDK